MKKLIPFLLLFFACQKSKTQPEPPKVIGYETSPVAMALSTPIKEASGITYSNSIAEHIWLNQDSGNPPMVYLLKSDGTVTDSVMIDGATNRDWEDIALGKVPFNDQFYLFVGDIGDNDARYAECVIYRFPEPVQAQKNVTDFDRIRFVYPDGPRDAEALLVDDITGNIYIISKRDAKSRVYRLSYPQSDSTLNEAEFITELSYGGVVSATLSFNSEELIVKTYTEVRHYEKKTSQDIEDVLKNVDPKILAYQVEPQGEAVSFAKDGSGFYTLSEEAMGVLPRLYFYKKK